MKFDYKDKDHHLNQLKENIKSEKKVIDRFKKCIDENFNKTYHLFLSKLKNALKKPLNKRMKSKIKNFIK